jgi:prevent-host-death family protein
MGTAAAQVFEELVPISDFEAHAADLLRRVAETGKRLVITQNGKAAGVLLSPAEFDRLSQRTRFAHPGRSSTARREDHLVA